jgi:hypothetical protein
MAGAAHTGSSSCTRVAAPATASGAWTSEGSAAVPASRPEPSRNTRSHDVVAAPNAPIVTATSGPDGPDFSARCSAIEEPGSDADHRTFPSAARRSTRRASPLPSTSTTLAAVTITSGSGHV